MKILKQDNPKLKEYLFKCSNCECIFVEREENSFYVNVDKKGRRVACYCYCPCCGYSCISDEIYTEEKDGDENG